MKKIMRSYTADCDERVFFGIYFYIYGDNYFFSFCTRTVTCGTKTEKLGLWGFKIPEEDTFAKSRKKTRLTQSDVHRVCLFSAE